MMRIRFPTLGAILWAAAAAAPAQSPVGPDCTYQGYLTDAGRPVNDDYDFRFTLYDAEVGGNVIAGPIEALRVAVAGGLFSVELNFGEAAFTGDERWLEIGARRSDAGGDYTTLSPRQHVTAGPFAVLAMNLRLPYFGQVASNLAPAFQVRQLGMRESGVFEIKNPGNAMTALTGFTDGTGLGFQAWTTGTGGAAYIDIPNQQNVKDVLESVHFGLGRAGHFEVVNPANRSPALEARSDGLGPAGLFSINNANNAGNAIHTRTVGGGYAMWAENLGPANAAIFANSQRGPGAEIVTQFADAPAVQATNMAGGLALLANGSVETNRQLRSTVAPGTAPLAVVSSTLNVNLNADMLDGLHAADLDARYVNEGQANAISTGMMQNDSVNVDKLAHNINASGIGFNAAQVNGAAIQMGTWNSGSTTPFISLHGGDVTVSGTGAHNEKLRFTNNLGGEVRISIIGNTDAMSSVTTLFGGGSSVDITYPHYTPFMVTVSEAASFSEWTTVMWCCENDGRGSYLAINHDN